ncbi:HD domain-containing protein [Halorubrum sp. JWXQ-INN 858]|uniref:HD domain-containing protein n=1 Tax=Halorubrum sp. JWXQ-INN 858 TaxID=2690782 RepID=UPI00135CB1D0|nr:HD family hydrolase [Halorubrum sp. JWXQ-INN 858]MWV65320.1 HD domain-containing protein [Halorubrum sp. JWXQ-INN 858]
MNARDGGRDDAAEKSEDTAEECEHPGGEDATDDPAVIDAVLDAYALKDECRTGWQLRGVRDPESVAAHTWGVAYLVLALGDRFREDLPGVDLDRALRLAVVHDVAEAETGDVPRRADPDAESVDPDAKAATERAAMVDLAGPLPERVREAWEAYEARESPEAVLVKECDLLDGCLQATVYERDDRYDPAAGDPDAFVAYDDLDEFFATAEPRLRTDAGRGLFERIRERYRAYRERTGG